MPITPPQANWKGLFNNLGGQGNQFQNPLSNSNSYYAFLSDVTFIPATQLYSVFLEMMPKEWADNAIFSGNVLIRAIAPSPPATSYHFPSVRKSDMLAWLGLKPTDDLIEGSWFEITIQQSTDDDDLAGYFYDPGIDMNPNIRPPQ